MELIFSEGGPDLELIGVGGTLRRLTRSFVGPFAVRTVEGHFADRLFLSVKGLTEQGVMTDADALEAEVKRTMIEQSGQATLLVDRSKLGGARAQRRGVARHGRRRAGGGPVGGRGGPAPRDRHAGRGDRRPGGERRLKSCNLRLAAY